MKAIDLYTCIFLYAFEVPLPKVRAVLDSLLAAGLAPGIGNEVDADWAAELLDYIRDDESGVKAWLLSQGYPLGGRLCPSEPERHHANGRPARGMAPGNGRINGT